jgi:O-antigen/teichoic acid export membrane protein
MQGTMIKRIAKMLAVLGTSMGLNLVVQLLLPPAFLHYYGIKRYGEWLVLSATVSYLSTLNFGVTTYASNQLTMLYKRGEMGEYRRLQGSTLAMILCMIGIGLILISCIFFLPLTTLLHLTTMSRAEATMTAFFLGLLAVSNIFAGYYNNLFMVVEKAHRGISWSVARWSISTLICIPLAMIRTPFSVIAIGQFSAALIIALLTVWDLKRLMGPLPLGLKGANWKTAKASLAPSGMFAMIFTQQFLLFQAPVIMLNWILGPEVVVLFTICRTISSTARQVLQTITYAIAPEVTFSFAERDMKKLLSIYHNSEKVVFSVIPIANLGAFLASPILLTIWLHKPQLFDPYVYGLMALISAAMSMRDHKQFFQFSTNTHKRLSIIVFFGNILMIAASIPFTIKFGIYGFMFTWLVSEVLQMVLIYHENKRLFRNDPSIKFLPILKLWLVMAVSLPICMGLVHFGQRRSLTMVGAAAVVGLLLLIVESYFVFGLKDVWTLLQNKLRHNHPATTQGA